MRFKILCVLTGALLGALSVSSVAAAVEKPPAPADGYDNSPSTTSAIDTRGASTQGRWFGQLPKVNSGCPPVVGWKAAPWAVDRTLYDHDREKSAERAAADQALLHNLGLDRFCVYTATPDAQYPFPKPAGLVAAAADRMALAANADELDQEVSPVLALQFLRETGSTSLLFKPRKSSVPAVPPVRLTFVDSQPDSDELSFEPPTGSQHGYSLGHLARQLVCGAPGCIATIATRRALQYVDFTPGQLLPPAEAASHLSGHVGLVSDLAAAIVAEVRRWRQDSSQDNGPKHLILNLSLGWDGELFGDLDVRKVSRLEPSVQAVYGALRFAAKRGVLVIAAAGNRRGGPRESHWPLLPAAWELRRPSYLPFACGPKLVYAVGGVDWQGLPLPNSRRGGRPQRVAYGDHAVATVAGHSSTAIYTGTSVSAAVVSSIAAVVWGLRPELQPDQIMRLIGRSGKTLKSRADFYPLWRDIWPFSHLLPHPEMQRSSLCPTVVQACGPGAVRCPALVSAPECPLSDGQPPVLSAILDHTTPSAHPFSSTSLPPVFIPPCDRSMQLLTADGQVPAAPCPTDQFGSVASQRWVIQQPEDDPCPGCTLLPKPPRSASLFAAGPFLQPEVRSDIEPSLRDETQLYALKLQISESWLKDHPGVILESATLDIDRYVDGVFTARLTYPISFSLTSGQPKIIEGLGDGLPLMGYTAQLNFVVVTPHGKRMSIQNPVVVDP